MCTHCHAGATLGEVDHSGVELVFEQVGMGNHSASQSQTGGSHQRCTHHCAGNIYSDVVGRQGNTVRPSEHRSGEDLDIS